MTYFANNFPMRFKRLETVSLLSTGILMEVSPVCSSFSTMESTSWAVASGDFKVSAKPERKDIPWATKSFGWFERLVTDSLFEDEFVCCWMEISSFFSWWSSWRCCRFDQLSAYLFFAIVMLLYLKRLNIFDAKLHIINERYEEIVGN